MSEFESPAPVTRPRYAQPGFWADWAERVAWTAVQGGLAIVTVDNLDLPTWAVPTIAAALAAVKGFVARQVGKSEGRDDASTVPAS